MDFKKLEPWKLKWMETPGEPLSYREDKMKLSKDQVNDHREQIAVAGRDSAGVFEYRLGNRSALDWVIDHYQVSEDKRA